MNILESSTHSGCQAVINEIEHQRALIRDLHDLILPTLDPCSRQEKLAQQLFQDIFSSSSKVISFLELGDNSKNQANLIKYRRKGGKNNMDSPMLGEEAKEIGNKRRKNAQHTGSVVTQAPPHFDGYQWRKYGQKWISKAKHSRSYYRCANSKDQGCLATKTVQQKESDGSSGTVRLFDVDYYGQHICMTDDIIHPYVVETTHYTAPMANHNQSSSGSTVVDNDVHEILDESFENLFMMPSIPEYLTDFTDIEMAGTLDEATSLMISEDIWS
ncbi:unnamed protein product [Miscanthus lutarioriparius]|uniref:WRKY domain-containing protein n=1 Tax=Miscanthus lutarioriparius TaxID=422564 RepID=A0A811RKY1_9POAL|nr:unnamed protein product [Miscanthus lutarioriparius]